MAKVIINAKADPVLKEAIREVAFRKRTTSSALQVEILEKDPDIRKEMSRMKKEGKKVA